MPIFNEIKGKNVPIKLWTPVNELESGVIDQLRNVATLPWVYKQVCAMPDAHVGIGCCVGAVIAMKNAVSPSTVGVDLGCGIMAIKTSLTLDRIERKLKQLRAAIEETIPVGFNGHETYVASDSSMVGLSISNDAKQLFSRFKELDPYVQKLLSKASVQCGTLGGGNHYLEICSGKGNNDIWLMLHSGSRNIGKELAEVHISKAKDLTHNRDLPDKALAVFLAGTPEMVAYRRDLTWAQEYAAINRRVMMRLLKNVMESFWPGVEYSDEVNCHHNYVAEEVHFGEQVLITRKGAIRAGLGEMGVIPGSMGTQSYIVRGLGNEESFQSASHGAGRRMSRGKAKERFTKEDAERQLDGVECKKDRSIFDELPGAYKNIEQVMANQSDLVEIIAEIKQVVCVKG